jgi:hypothetical protein
MEKYDNILVGGGIAGLICGGYLAKAGQKTIIFESKSKVGGRLTSHAFKGYKPTVHGLCYHPTLGKDGFWPVAAKELGAKINMKMIGFAGKVWWRGKGMQYTMRSARNIQDMIDLAAVQSPEPLTDAGKKEFQKIFEEIVNWDYTRLGPDLDTVRLSDWLDERTKNPLIPYFFLNLFAQFHYIDYADAKKYLSAGKNFTIYRQLLGREGKGGIPADAGTLYDNFIKPFSDAVTSLGADIKCESIVNKVIVENDEAKGVLVTEKEGGSKEYFAKRVIVNCPFPFIPRLFDKLPEEISEPVKELEQAWVIDICTFSGLEKKVTDEIMVVFAQEPKDLSFLLTANAISNGAPNTAPPGKHLMWAERCFRKEDFKKKPIEQHYKEIDQVTEEIFPGFKDAIEVQSHFSHSLCWQHQYSAYKKIPQKPKSISDLYFIGDSTAPQYGTGTDGTASTGMMVAQHILNL